LLLDFFDWYEDLNNLNARLRGSLAADGWTEANLYFLHSRKCKQVLVPLPRNSQ
jgi:hypothetical protein